MRPLPSRLARRALALSGLLGVLELGLAAGDIDTRVLRHFLFWVEGYYVYAGGQRLYRSSADPRRLYELIPGAEATCLNCPCPYENRLEPCPYPVEYKVSRIRVNRLGFRGPDRPAKKRPGVFRIVVVGGSHTLGPSVNDEDTFPQALETMLNSRGRGRFEVWNAGLSSYVLSQKAAYAEEIAARYEPDLLILSHDNAGRRAFLWGDPGYRRLFRANPELYLENLPRPARWPLPEAAHEWFVLRCRSYRAALALYYLGALAASGGGTERVRSRLFPELRLYGDRVSAREIQRFAKEATVRLAFFSPLDDAPRPAWADPRVPWITLPELARAWPKNFPREHPPPAGYRLYARGLLRELARRRLVPL